MHDDPGDPDVREGDLSVEAIAAGRPTAWFEQLYAEGVAGSVSMPWDRSEPHVLLREWAERAALAGDGRRAVVVGCGLGADAAYLATLGFSTVGFDIAPTAVAVARERHGELADYRVADLLDLPPEWLGAFDLVVEIFTLQALPDPPRTAAADGIISLVAPGGTLLAIYFRADSDDDEGTGPPYSLGRATVDGLARDGLSVVAREELPGPRWRVEYVRG